MTTNGETQLAYLRFLHDFHRVTTMSLSDRNTMRQLAPSAMTVTTDKSWPMPTAEQEREMNEALYAERLKWAQHDEEHALFV